MNEYQEIINYLTNRIPHKNVKELSIKIARVLGIKEKTCYNKLKGISQFKIVEVFQIAYEYGIPLDTTIFKEVGVQRPFPFIARGYHYKPRMFNEYLENLIFHFEPLVPYRKVVRR